MSSIRNSIQALAKCHKICQPLMSKVCQNSINFFVLHFKQNIAKVTPFIQQERKLAHRVKMCYE